VIPIIWPVALGIGRWWATPLTAVAWAILLLVDGTIGMSDVPLAAMVAAANAVPFALIGAAFRHLGEALARRRATAS
jgi:hypothetical protein